MKGMIVFGLALALGASCAAADVILYGAGVAGSVGT